MSGSSANGVFWQLARPATDADRNRVRLVSIAVAGCGMFLLAALAILTITGDVQGQSCADDVCPAVVVNPGLAKFAPYLAQRGLRGGTALGAVLLVIPFVLFGVQALRTGTAARERRLAALSLAGATRPQLRRLAFLEGTRAAAIGAVLAGPAYLLLWLVFGVLLPDGWKMLPDPGWAVAAGWPVLVVLLALAGGLAARAAARPATISPLGLTRRAARGLGPSSVVGLILPVIVVVLVVAVPLGLRPSMYNVIFPIALLVALVALAINGGPWLIQLIGVFAIRRGLVTSMAGRRLLADVRSPGRGVGVLIAVGIAFSVIALGVASLLLPEDGSHYDDLGFYLVGYLAAGIGGLVACVVASGSLVVGATEQVLDGRRGTAVLVSLAASPSFVSRVVRRQLLLAAVPAAGIGALLGWSLAGYPYADSGLGLLVALPCGLGCSVLAAWIGALVAARAVRPAILAASTPDNLRTP
jgi:hypothetical protein